MVPSHSLDLSFCFLYRNYGLRYMYLVHSSTWFFRVLPLKPIFLNDGMPFLSPYLFYQSTAVLIKTAFFLLD